MLPISLDTFLNDLSARVGVQYTDEQRALMRDFTSPIISFSSPGTGKTKSAIGGLLTAELYHQVPGNQIYALSFTNMSTGELQVRHKQDCERVGIKQTVNFQTLHSLCSRILKENYKSLGIGKLKVVDTISIEEQADLLLDISKDRGIPLHPWQVRPFVNAVRSLNSSLVFDRSHVESKYAFKQCRMPYEDFTTLRKFLYLYTKMTETLQVQDILIYTLELLLSHPEISAAFKLKCHILLVDEFQDLSLLQLRIISLLSNTVIAIGDVKQQIYAFNGACQEIVGEFKKYFPSARELNLNKSFRCADSIVDYSKAIIHPNAMQEQDFVGTGKAGTVEVIPRLPLSAICDTIEKQYRDSRNTFPRDVLFLFRNNYSAVPIAEELFQRKVPFQVNKYQAANQMPVIKEMCAVVELASNPYNLQNFYALRYILPEQKDYKEFTKSPIYRVCEKEGCSIFEAPYNFRNAMAAKQAMELLLSVQDMLSTQKPMREILNQIYPLFNEVYLTDREHYLEMPSTYYINMAHSVVQTKTYYSFIKDEMAKMQVIQDSNARRHGVRCYTFHASKGLEADDVYILDADENVVPNTHKLDIMEKAGCVMEKAREIRNERSLLFVATTRAKEHLTITYTGTKTSLLTSMNIYESYDKLYTQFQLTYPDVEAFEQFYKGGLSYAGTLGA